MCSFDLHSTVPADDNEVSPRTSRYIVIFFEIQCEYNVPVMMDVIMFTTSCVIANVLAVGLVGSLAVSSSSSSYLQSLQSLQSSFIASPLSLLSWMDIYGVRVRMMLLHTQYDNRRYCQTSGSSLSPPPPLPSCHSIVLESDFYPLP